MLTVRKTMKAAKREEAARAAARTIAIRGVVLVSAFFLTWVLWTGVGFSTYFGTVPSIPLETVAALITALQPIIDGLILLYTPVVRANMLQRHLKQVGESEINPSFVKETTMRPKSKTAAPQPVHSAVSNFSDKGSTAEYNSVVTVPGWRTTKPVVASLPERSVVAKTPRQPALVRSYTFANHEEGLSSALLRTPESSPVHKESGTKKRSSTSKGTNGTKSTAEVSTSHSQSDKRGVVSYSES